MISNIYSNSGYDFFTQKFKNRQDLISYLKNAKTSLAFSKVELASNKTSDEYEHELEGINQLLEGLDRNKMRGKGYAKHF